MNWTRVSLFCLGTALLASSQPAFAQVVSEQTGVVQLEDYSGSMSLANDGGSWMQVDRMSGDGVGFQNGFTRVGVRNKWAEFGNSHVFTELNGTMNDHGRLGTNVGLGYRTMYDSGVLGVSGWYDNYESNYGHNYQQATVGAEYLHEFLDLRANGYMPFGDRDNFIGVIDPGTDLSFQGHDFGTIGRAQVERSLSGFDAEAGVPLPIATFLKAFAGTYFLRNNASDDTWGVRSRLEARIGEGATLNFMVTDDDMFGTNLNFGATVWYGGGPTSPFKFQRDRSGWSRRYDPVRRNQPVQLEQDRDVEVFVPLVNTDTGNEFNITWVDNEKVAPGDGTFENPFVQLPGTAPGSDYILVRRGTGDTLGNIVLEDNQHMFGEGRVYTLNTDRLGTVEIPDQFFDQTGPRPTLRPTAGAVPTITLASHNEVINFNITGGTAAGIFGNFVEDFRIEHVRIENSVGIFLNDASGNGLLNNIDVPTVGPGQTGITVRNQFADRLNLTMTDITTSGGNSGLLIDAFGAEIIADIDGLTIDNTAATGLALFQDSGLLNVNLQNAVVNSNNDGMLISSFAGQSNIDLLDVTVRGAGDLIFIEGDAGTILTVDGLNVDASDSLAGSGIIADVDNSAGLFRFENLTASNNGDDGFRLNASNGSIVLATITDSDVSSNGDNNFEVNASGGSVVQFFVDPTSATDSGNEAYQFVATDLGTVLTTTFIDVDLARAGQSAISGQVTLGALSRMFLTNVQASDAGIDGLRMSVENGLGGGNSSNFEAFITNSTFTRSGRIGVNLSITNDANVLLNMDETPANNNGSEGFHYEVLTGPDGASSLIANVSSSLLPTQANFSDNPVNNVFGQVTGAGSTAALNFTNVTADLLGANSSVQLGSFAGGRTDVLWTGAQSSISQSTADGVNLTADGAGSILNFRFEDGRINSNGGQGIDALASNDGEIRIDLRNAEVTLNTQQNILGSAVTGGQVFVNTSMDDPVPGPVNLSNGGVGTNLDNVLLTADGAGSIVGGDFDDVLLDGSGLNGLHAVITNNGSLQLNFSSTDFTSSASNNLNGSGIRIEATGADSVVLTSTGNSIISGNQADNVDVDVLTANIASIQIAGQLDNSLSGDGINVNFDDVDAGGISIGPGTAIDNFDDGIDILVTNSTLNNGISITGMNVNWTAPGTGDEPIVVVTQNSTITGGTISNNNVDGGDNSNNGISWTSSGTGTVDVDISNNVVTGVSDNGILVALSDSVIASDLNIDFNTITGDGVTPQNGIQLNLSDTAQVQNGTINGNTVTSAANYGVLVTAADTSVVNTLTVDANILSQSGIDGFLYTTSGNTTLNSLVVSDNAVDSSGGSGLNVLLDNVEGNGNVEFRGNLVSNNVAHGIAITGIDTSLTNVDFLQNESTNNGGDGIHVDLTAPGAADTLGSVTGLNNTVTGNGGAGVNVALDGFTNTPDVIFDGTIATGNTAEGIVYSVSNMDANQLSINGSTLDNNGADGALISLLNGTTNAISIDANTANANALNGLNLQADNAVINSLSITNNEGFLAVAAPVSVRAWLTQEHWRIQNLTSDPNVLITSVTYNTAPTGLTTATTRGTIGTPYEIIFNGAAVGVNAVNGNALNLGAVQQPGVLADNISFFDTTFTDFSSLDPHYHFDVVLGNAAANVSQPTAAHAGMVFTANFSNGSQLSGAFDAAGDITLTQAALVTASGISDNGLAGILVGLHNGSSLGAMNIDNNDVIQNGTNGIQFDVTGGSTLPTNLATSTISNNLITRHASGDGVTIVNPDTGGADFEIGFQGNEITNNGGEGVNIQLEAGAGVMTTEFVGNTIATNANNGVLLQTTDTSGIVVQDFSTNVVSSNGNMGVRMDAAVSSSINFAAGISGDAANRNIIAGNTNAGIGAVYRDDSTGSVQISNTNVSGTVAGTDANFDGSGIRVVTQGNARLGADPTFGASFVVGGNAATPGLTNVEVSANEGSGISLVSGQQSGIYDPAAPRGPEIRNALITQNELDGINITRFGSAKIDDIIIENNTITVNSGNGINLALQGGNVDIDQPLPNTSLVIDATIQDNVIDSNGVDDNGFNVASGILLDLDADVHLNATVANNEVTNNAIDGVTINGQFDSILNGTWSANTITGNNRDGINLTLTERATAGSAMGDLIFETSNISNNGRDGIRVLATNSINPTVAPDVNLLIQDNGPTFPGDPTGIHNNAGSGINVIAQSISDVVVQIDDNEIYANGLDGVTATSEDVAALQVDATGNVIRENGRHGVNLTNSELALQVTTLTDNQILLNTRRGVSLLNQGQFADSVLTIAGTVDPIPSSGTLATSVISQNGEVGVYVENNAGVLESFNTINLDLNNTAIIGNGTNTSVAADQRNGVYIHVGTSGGFIGSEVGGFVNAVVDQNFMSGNGNVDFVTDSFVATPDPSVASQYTSANYRFDPLARLGLSLSNNQGDSIDVVRTGAFYNNADAFKSPNALFDDTNRRRNAQRFSNDLLILVDTVSGSTAPTTTSIAANITPGGAGLPNNTFNDLGIDIAGDGAIGGANRDVTAYAAATNVITFAPALGAAPAVGTPFDLEAINISGLGLSTFRTDQVSVAAGGNVFTNVITDFATNFTLDPTNPGDPDIQPILGNPQTFTWQTLGLPFY